LLDEVSFGAPEEAGTRVIDAAYVTERLADVVGNTDLSGYIL
jgi:ATP-dependent HslUV protease ATP-binding subunit HslU